MTKRSPKGWVPPGGAFKTGDSGPDYFARMARERQRRAKNVSIRTITKKPGEHPTITRLDRDEESFLAFLDGSLLDIRIRLPERILILSDARAYQDSKPYNCTIHGAPYYGNVILCGFAGGEFSSIPVGYEQLKQMWPDVDEKTSGALFPNSPGVTSFWQEGTT